MQEADVIKIARGAGWSDSDVPTAVTIASFESAGGNGWNENATSPANSDGSHDHGLWQINDKANADIIAKYGNVNDPVANAQMAKAVYDRQGWNAWTTYQNRNSNGAWGPLYDKIKFDTAHVPGVTTSKGTDNAPGITNTVNAVKSAINPLDTIAKLASLLGDPNFWKRVGIGALAVGILLFGIVLMLDSSKTVQGATKIAGKLA